MNDLRGPLLTGFTKTEHIYGETLYQKPPWQALLEMRDSKQRSVNIRDRFTLSADKVMMRRVIGLDAHRTVMQTHLVKDAALNKQVDIFVDSSQGDGRNPPFHSGVNLFWTWVSLGDGKHLVDDLTLMRHS